MSSHVPAGVPAVLVTAGVVGSLVAAAAPAGAIGAAAAPAPDAGRSPAAVPAVLSGTSPAAARVTAVLSHLGSDDGEVAVVSPSGLSRPALAADRALAERLNKLDADRQSADLGGSPAVLDAAGSSQDTVIQVVPGVVVTVSKTGAFQVSISKEDVTLIKDATTIGAAVASVVGGILGIIPGTAPGSSIAGLVAAGINLGQDVFNICVGPSGSFELATPGLDGGELACGGLSLNLGTA